MEWSSIASIAASITGIFGLIGFIIFVILYLVGKYSIHQSSLSEEVIDALKKHGLDNNTLTELSKENLEVFLKSHNDISQDLIDKVMSTESHYKGKTVFIVSILLILAALFFWLISNITEWNSHKNELPPKDQSLLLQDEYLDQALVSKLEETIKCIGTNNKFEKNFEDNIFRIKKDIKRIKTLSSSKESKKQEYLTEFYRIRSYTLQCYDDMKESIDNFKVKRNQLKAPVDSLSLSSIDIEIKRLEILLRELDLITKELSSLEYRFVR